MRLYLLWIWWLESFPPLKFFPCPDSSYFQTDCQAFDVDKSIGASPGSQAGSEASVEVCFEPHQLGEVRGQLSLSSAAGGEYIFPLHGTCLPPKPQGPFIIRAGRTNTIPFKNVFLQATAFSFQVKTWKSDSSFRWSNSHSTENVPLKIFHF